MGHLSVDDQNFDDNNQDSDESYADHGHHHANVVQKPLLLLLPFDLFVDFTDFAKGGAAVGSLG